MGALRIFAACVAVSTHVVVAGIAQSPRFLLCMKGCACGLWYRGALVGRVGLQTSLSFAARGRSRPKRNEKKAALLGHVR